eukprot:TRINITY_DN34099_c0_g1_i2.p1 TRINITY_DN34099_c0_g1~~TRINITY_DN34099_c0_g1_i2.p1  ORF type:complete len:203 (-),score=52.59 TRINITY_DN34099_c0_g1_i2:38-646(-)
MCIRDRYSTKSAEALAMIQKDEDLFHIYHQGFAEQVKTWPTNPVDVFIAHLKTRSPELTVADFGCGEAKLSLEVPQEVHSFDLASPNERVVACDMAHVPLEDEVVDMAVFSLSLMGTNYVDFLKEASRVLKIRGELRIAEVKSRIDDLDRFVALLSDLGFYLQSKDEQNKMFVMLVLVKQRHVDRKAKVKAPALKACQYKKR